MVLVQEVDYNYEVLNALIINIEMYYTFLLLGQSLRGTQALFNLLVTLPYGQLQSGRLYKLNKNYYMF